MTATSGTDMAHKFRPGDKVMYCGVEYLVGSIFHGEAELTTMSGVMVDYIPVHALNRLRDGSTRKSSRGHGVTGLADHIERDRLEDANEELNAIRRKNNGC